MKMNFVLSAFAMLAMTAGAQAADQVQNDINNRKLYEFNFKCEFEGRDGDTDRNEREDARAFAKVYAWVSHGDWSKDMQMDTEKSNKLAVIHDGELKYANGALLNSKPHYVEISGVSGSPSIFVKRSHHDVLENKWMKYDAALKLHRHKLEGECYVKAEPVRNGGDMLN